MPGWKSHNQESRLPGEISTTSDDRYHYNGRKQRETKQPLDQRVKGESEKAGLKFNIQKKKIMASCPITSWQTDGETKETLTDFIFLGYKVTADVDCSHEIKRCLLLGRKALTNLEVK